MAAGDSTESAIAVAPTGRDRISLVICAVGSEKRNPAKAGIKFVHFGGILQTAGDRGGSGSRLASPCPVRRAPGARGSKRDINSNLPTGAANVTDCPSKWCESSGTVARQSSCEPVDAAAGRAAVVAWRLAGRAHQEPNGPNALGDVAHRRAVPITCSACSSGRRSISCALHGCAQVGYSRKYLINRSMKLRTLAGTC